MGEFIKRIKRLYVILCYVAWFVNIFILLIGAVNADKGLQALALLNMIMLSFVLIRDTNENST